jgi:hypothetical protein
MEEEIRSEKTLDVIGQDNSVAKSLSEHSISEQQSYPDMVLVVCPIVIDSVTHRVSTTSSSLALLDTGAFVQVTCA